MKKQFEFLVRFDNNIGSITTESTVWSAILWPTQDAEERADIGICQPQLFNALRFALLRLPLPVVITAGMQGIQHFNRKK